MIWIGEVSPVSFKHIFVSFKEFFESVTSQTWNLLFVSHLLFQFFRECAACFFICLQTIDLCLLLEDHACLTTFVKKAFLTSMEVAEGWIWVSFKTTGRRNFTSMNLLFLLCCLAVELVTNEVTFGFGRKRGGSQVAMVLHWLTLIDHILEYLKENDVPKSV